jgi:phosphatidylinositol alpha-1,6-mannosyltransferase
MIRAVAQLRAEGWALRYVIGGIGEDADYLDRLIVEHQLQDSVHRIGAVGETDLPRWLNACNLFAMPNRDINGDNEGFGMVFIEAAACGKPSLAGEAGGTGSAVLHQNTGLRVDGDSVDAVAAGLRIFLTAPEQARAWGQQALQRVQREFAWERVADKTRQLNK